MQIDIEQVKQYNAALKAQQDKATKTRTEIEINFQELTRQCEELSKELGITVTFDNLEQILAERIEKIQNTLRLGNEILARVARAEEQLNAPKVSTADAISAFQNSQAGNANIFGAQPAEIKINGGNSGQVFGGNTAPGNRTVTI